MGKIYGSALELIGNTPLVEVKNVEKSEGLEATVLAKLEYFKDRKSTRLNSSHWKQSRMPSSA